MPTHPIRLGILSLAAALVVGQISVLAQGDASGASSRLPEVELDTTEGKIVIELNSEKAPETVKNFLQYVESGHFEGTIFHRVIPDFMIQGGGMDEKMAERPTRAPIRNESANGLKNRKYTLAMARTDDPNSATSQFFINTKDNDFLDRDPARGSAGYAVFGRVVKGLDVVDKIGEAKTHIQPGPVRGMLMRDVPIKPVVITSAKVLEKE